MAESHDGGTPPTTWLAAGWALLTMAVAAVLRYWPQRRREARDETAAQAKIQSEERMEILRMYRQEILDLKMAMTEMAKRHKEEIDRLIAENNSLRDRLQDLDERLTRYEGE